VGDYIEKSVIKTSKYIHSFFRNKCSLIILRAHIACIKLGSIQREKCNKEIRPKEKPLIPKGITMQPLTLLIATVTWRECNLPQRNETSASNPQTQCVFHLHQQKHSTKIQELQNSLAHHAMIQLTQSYNV
jgi:hypothetical protein